MGGYNVNIILAIVADEVLLLSVNFGVFVSFRYQRYDYDQPCRDKHLVGSIIL